MIDDAALMTMIMDDRGMGTAASWPGLPGSLLETLEAEAGRAERDGWLAPESGPYGEGVWNVWERRWYLDSWAMAATNPSLSMRSWPEGWTMWMKRAATVQTAGRMRGWVRAELDRILALDGLKDSDRAAFMEARGMLLDIESPVGWASAERAMRHAEWRTGAELWPNLDLGDGGGFHLRARVLPGDGEALAEFLCRMEGERVWRWYGTATIPYDGSPDAAGKAFRRHVAAGREGSRG
jgi:hypothetical protein